MKRILMVLALSAGCLSPAGAAIYSTNWSSGFTAGGVIPSDGNGWWDTQPIAGLSGTLVSVAVRLHLVEALPEGNNSDLFAYLSHGGQTVILLNRVGRTAANPGGYLDPGMDITLSDTDPAATDVHLYGGTGFTVLTGTWQPDGRDIDPTSTGAEFDAATRQNSGAPLGLLNGLDPDGDWTIYFSDQGAAGQSTVASWGLDIEAVPEPVSVALGVLAGAALLVEVGQAWRRRRISTKTDLTIG
jgi:hypothetical protein